ncbi:nuclear pore protein 84/107 [Piptocephalis cylindrospora]|uniref:Nuclear pore complex protein n=1 Tax=Piptocephalis cylindrospora TaxID=1907219 RepID=A0A4P9Y1G9_9FUNG|nr:nuclear pore protein 84/107 [Piptocephalis cylindrospora]|eukprot:RKP12686.1 nuclear pore protein 84/107 [Piptocephalis cylindrospora]
MLDTSDLEAGFLVEFSQLASESKSSLGLLSSFHQAVLSFQDKVRGSDVPNQADLLDHLTLEAHTWDLFHRLVQVRLEREKADTSTPPPESKNFHEAFSRPHGALLEEHVLMKWLHQTAPPYQCPSDQVSDGWEYTERRAMQERLTGVNDGGVISDLDPDAPFRQTGRTLAPLDLQAERGIHRTTYEYLRRGWMDKLGEYLRGCGQGWRVASIHGGKLRQAGPMVDPAEQVKRRTVWRSMCYRLAKDDRPDAYERAAYSLLSGDITGSLQVCTRWEDVVHAFVNGVLECKYQGLLDRMANREENEDDRENRLLLPRHGEDWDLGMVIDRVQLLNQPGIRQEGEHPLRRAQASIIARRMDGYLQKQAKSTFGSLGEKGMTRKQWAEVRFLVHFGIVLRSLGSSLSNADSQESDGVDEMVEVYIRCLRERGLFEHLATYCSLLTGQRRVEVFALQLAEMRVDSGVKERYARQGRTHGLDMLTVGKLAVSEIYDQTRFMLEEMHVGDGSDGAMMMRRRGKVTDVEMRCIDGLDWLSGPVCGPDPGVKKAWVRWTNAFSRRFLLSSRVDGLIELLRRTTPEDEEVEETSDMDSDVLELGMWRRIASVYVIYGQWQGLRLGGPQAADQEGWRGEWVRVSQQLVGQMMQLLQEGLGTPFPPLENDPCKKEKVEIRELYVPRIASMCHECLMGSVRELPENLDRCFDLASLVADGSLGLWRDFVSTGQLEEFLGRMRLTEEERLKQLKV